MPLVSTLNVYFAKRFALWIVGLFVGCTLLILLVDVLEVLKRAGEREEFSFLGALLLSLFRVPFLSEQVLPFATLFGAMISFLALSKRLELVVVRSAGVSVWQFLAPAVFIALILGVIAILVYNPIAGTLKTWSDDLAVEYLGNQRQSLLQSRERVWLRQDSPDGEAIISAGFAEDQGLTLKDVTIVTFGEDGRYSERVEAAEARLGDKRWEISDATVYVQGLNPRTYDHYILSTYLGPEEVKENFAEPETLSVWQLNNFILVAERAGLPTHRYVLQFQSLLARPLLLASMVLIAAVVSLGFARFGGLAPAIFGGVISGFMLYVATEVTSDLGSAGTISPVVAAWSPGVIATLLGVTFLLHREDG